ncbi:tRNA(Ile)-lysidine synthase [Streptoalloteichus tenebrarius]|uniref:tRNA(Ile)-lysidine synthase n=1 Tax=Streptoalloteichus tenebrarius (strain ATCC 17920 / DSM 40477 / JCM 4838 / CBS 697.72 / NBRC 16177 / NCIMB 11028 / NRRL B-12390 / A12253. 1 / ISP 5477) TaxID=1933 RepID=A0ABT1HQZ8_STRSD|nr:tRNA(Ile)-lysidine synthase [Streptoalloteichus tenebrarius]BFF01591.1 tRNA lysidine(34) synthetase TilS [Streptoalloteichus tenebrarius]
MRRLLDTAPEHLRSGAVAVACSGGADSLALAAAATHVARHRDLSVHGLVVDHGLQPGSAGIAEEAASRLRELGCAEARVLTVRVTGRGGPEAAARRARYAALDAARPPGALVLLGHTRNDQAETVLLGLGRGSGPRSIAGMRPLDPPWARPFLDVSRTTTAAACAALGLRPWDDPHNADPRFTRVRLRREVLPLLEEVLRGGVAEALARTAAQLREDAEALDQLAAGLLADALGAAGAGDGADTTDVGLDTGSETEGAGVDAPTLAAAPVALRRRALRAWLLGRGVTGLTDQHLRRVDALLGAWRGQGGVALPGGLVVRRAHGRLHLDRPQQRG